MEKKLKKQRRKLIIKISAILIAVWLVISCAYSVLTFFSEKDREYRNAQITFSMWQRNMEPYVTNPVLFMDEARKTAIYSQSGADSDVSFEYNHNVNIVVKEQESKQEYDSDDIININFTAESIRSGENRIVTWLRISDSDTDYEIPSNEQLFDPLSETLPLHGNTNNEFPISSLDLPFAKHLAELMGGTLNFRRTSEGHAAEIELFFNVGE